MHSAFSKFQFSKVWAFERERNSLNLKGDTKDVDTQGHKCASYLVKTDRNNPLWHFLSFIFTACSSVKFLSSVNWHFVGTSPTLSQRNNLVHRSNCSYRLNYESQQFEEILTYCYGRWDSVWRRGWWVQEGDRFTVCERVVQCARAGVRMSDRGTVNVWLLLYTRNRPMGPSILTTEYILKMDFTLEKSRNWLPQSQHIK